MLVLRKAVTVVLLGADLTAGYYADWATYLASQLQEFPEVKGPLDIINLGEPGWTSTQAAAAVAGMAALRPDIVLIDSFALTDTHAGAVDQATHTANLTAIVAAFHTANPAAHIALQTMSPVTAGQAAHYANLAAFYAADTALAAGLGVELLDHYAGTVQAPAGWPKPLAELNTYPTVPFVFAKTPGFFGQVATAAIDMAHVPGNAAVVGSTVTGNGSLNGFVRGNTPITAPTHFEIGVVGDVRITPMIGLAVAAANYNARIASDGNSMALIAQNLVVINGGVAGQLTTYPTTTSYRVGMEVDPVNKVAWFIDQQVRQGPFDISGLMAVGAIYPAWNPYANGGQAGIQFSEACDGIHPVWSGMQDTYVFPAVVAWMRAKLGALWP